MKTRRGIATLVAAGVVSADSWHSADAQTNEQ